VDGRHVVMTIADAFYDNEDMGTVEFDGPGEWGSGSLDWPSNGRRSLGGFFGLRHCFTDHEHTSSAPARTGERHARLDWASYTGRWGGDGETRGPRAGVC